MIYDISPPVSSHLAVWPGDTPPSREVLCDMEKGSNLTLSTLHATVHLGAHADAPSHYGANAPSIEQRDFDHYLGPCQVMRLQMPRDTRVTPADIKVPIRAERILVGTGTYPDPNHFNEDFAGLAPQLVERFHKAGVVLVGIDTPSVDPFASKDLPAHKRCLAADMAILEGLVLDHVPGGVYDLIALPLRLVGFDASPVRAVLRTID